MSNIRKVHKLADAMADEVRAVQNIAWRLPNWAGLAWIISPYYSGSIANNVRTSFGPEWWARATRLIRALDIAASWRADQKLAS